MNYFNELLQSYGLLKQRKLKLLEQAGSNSQINGNSPQERVADIIAKTKPLASSVSEGNPLLLYLGEKEFKCWVARSSKQVTVQYGVAKYNAEKNPKGLYKHLETAGAEETEAQPSAGEAEAQGDAQTQVDAMQQYAGGPLMTGPIPGTIVAQAEIALTDPLAAQKMTEQFAQLNQKLNKIWESLSQDFRKFYRSQMSLSTRLTGSNMSLEKQISTAFVVVKDDDGNLVTVKASGDAQTSLSVSKSINRIIDIVSKNEITDSDRAELDSLAALTSDGEVVIFDEGGDQGMLFRSGKSAAIKGGVMSAILKSFEEKFKHNIRIVDPDEILLSKENLALQSTFFEDIAGVLALGETCKESVNITKNKHKKVQGKRNTAPRKNYCARLLEALTKKYASKSEQLLKILTPMSLLEKSDQDYAMNLNSGDATMSFLRHLVRGGTQKMYQAIIRVAKHGIKERRAERSISKAQETKNGKRADATEIWSTLDQAMNALRNSGLTDEEIQTHGFIKEVSIEDAYGPNSKDLRRLDSFYQRGQKVFMLDISYKNYLNLKKKAAAGTCYASSREGFLNGRYSKSFTRGPNGELMETPGSDIINREADVKFRDTMARNLFGDSNLSLQPNSEFLTNLQQYHQSNFRSLFDSVRELPSDAKSLSPDKSKLIGSQPLKELAKAAIKKLASDHSYEELFGNKPPSEADFDKLDKNRDVKELYRYLNYYVEKSKGESTDDFIIKAKGVLATYLINKKLQRQLSSQDSNTSDMAKKYLAVKFFLAGGSNDDALLCDFRELYGKDNYVFRQNEAFGMVREWLSGNSNYEMTWKGNSYRLAKKDDQSIYITCNDSKVQGERDKEYGIQGSNTIVAFSSGLLKSLDKRRRGIVSSKDNDYAGSLILEFLESQKSILTKIFKVISKDV